MKRILVPVSLLILAAACATPTENANRATNMNANTAPEATRATISESEASAREKEAWDSLKKKDYDAFANLLASDYVEVSGEAIYDKDGSVKAVKDLNLTDATFSDWKFILIDKDAFIVTYSVNAKGTYKGKPFPPNPARASSAWVNRDGKWLAIYHQECEVKPPPPPPKAPAKGAKASPSPTARPAPAATGPDATSNEKIVWEALKSKNFDAFASYLAPDSIEVEPDGVYDKAGSVKGVSQFDFSKAVLSDFKVVNLDQDAALVTYLVKIPGMGMSPNGERHTTIWANRGGKWLALFHHGTPAEKPSPSPAAKASPSPAAKASPSPAMKRPGK